MEIEVINGAEIESKRIKDITSKIINILSKENITYAIAYVILNEVKNELENTLIKKCD